MVLAPLILILEPEPGSPFERVILTPDIFPCIALATDVSPDRVIASAFTVDTALPNLSVLTAKPNELITTSSKKLAASSFKATVSVV